MSGPLPALPGVAEAGADFGAVAKEYLTGVREVLAGRHRAGASGREIVAAYTGAVDRLVTFLFELATHEYTRRYVLLDHTCVVAAQGGYGRSELNPASDIDLLVLFPWRVNAYVETVAERIVYTLWDAGLTVGNATRTVSGCVRLAQENLKVKTALLDARYLAGDVGVYRQFETAMQNEVLKKNAARFYREKLHESQERHQKYGNSIYLLEPQLKEGPGGLRDIHTAMWLAKVKYKVKSIGELVQKGVITERGRQDIEASQDFIFRVRNALHFATGVHQDHLTFEFQERIAPELGFSDPDPRRAVEAFMKTYYRHATGVRRFADTIVERCLERPNPYRLIGRVTRRQIREGVRIVGQRLSAESAETLDRDPSNVVTLFRDAQRHGVPLTEGTKRLIRDHLGLIGDAERRDRAFTRPFLDIVGWKTDVWQTLREMHAVGVLNQLFPEFARIDCLVQRDPNHIYTVDEHSLMGIRELERLRRGDYKQSAPLLTEVMREIERPDVLVLGMLFHDIGKGHGERHPERGAAMIRDIAARLPVHEDDVAQWEFLVRHHLLMSHLAQHRDTHDPKLVTEFARTVGTLDSLRLLYVMTFADMRAVSPKVWNAWRDLLLGELYMQTRALFEQGQLDEDEHARAARVRARLVTMVPPARRTAFEAFLDTMPERYITGTPVAQVPGHFELVNALREDWSGRSPEEQAAATVTRLRHVPEAEYSEFTICTRDRPGLFAMITGVLTAQGMNIVGARINTSSDGVALDSFRVGHLDHRERVLEPERWERVQTTLERVLRNEVDVEALVAGVLRPSILEPASPSAGVATEVVVDNAIAADTTVLDVMTDDRVGVLFTITHALHRLGLVIHLAKITTQVHRVLDVFYVTDASGAKIVDPERLAAIERELVDRLERLARPAPAP